jgi:hypothetical protein
VIILSVLDGICTPAILDFHETHHDVPGFARRGFTLA